MTAAGPPRPVPVTPTATTISDLLERAHHLTGLVLECRDPVPTALWESFDQTLYRFLVETLYRRPVGPGLVEHEALPLYHAVKAYPTPLAVSPGTHELTLTEAARLTGIPRRTIHDRILCGQIPATRTRDGWQIPHRSLDLRSDVQPADPADPHPLARLAITLGALTDLLYAHQHDPDKPDLGTGPVTRLARDILALTDSVARHTLTLIEPDGLPRALAIARHAATSAARLAHGTDQPIPYAALPPPARHRAPGAPTGPTGRWAPASLPGLLDRAVTDWVRACRAELAVSVPSIEVIRNLTSQSVHVYAGLDALLAATTPSPDAGGPQPAPSRPVAEVDASIRAQLRAAAHDLQGAVAAWGPATTMVRPSLAYIEAAQQVHATLEQVIARAPDLGRLGLAHQRERALDSLTAACHDLAALTRQISPLPARLLDAGILFGHARSLEATTDRLRARITGRLVPLHHSDLPDLEQAILTAETAAAAIAHDLPQHITARRHPTREAEPATGPQL
ncbi:helix-turn-helix domain-containing protein [Intrasporangium sp.]|uniref:helix-turn-helix domain-containing protein n=1 Tax=Intrasporangium sp. TaxID=1925024 RepID=UPI003221F635